jgi:hypothetical protein
MQDRGFAFDSVSKFRNLPMTYDSLLR